MKADEFRALKSPPEKAAAPLAALWHAAQGDWDKAHTLIANDESTTAAWVHAHLHRAEGDLQNAGYWYGRAGKPVAEASPDQEWTQLTNALLLEGGW